MWVEIFNGLAYAVKSVCHAPHGACELKCSTGTKPVNSFLSRSPRSVWVEINHANAILTLGYVTLPTERVSWNQCTTLTGCLTPGHAPHGACELKWCWFYAQRFRYTSRSPRSVWVEMFIHGQIRPLHMSRSPRSVWVEMICTTNQPKNLKSRSPRSVWVEMQKTAKTNVNVKVTLPTERVSWNGSNTKILINGSGHAPHGACKWGRRGAILHKIVITENRR